MLATQSVALKTDCIEVTEGDGGRGKEKPCIPDLFLLNLHKDG